MPKRIEVRAGDRYGRLTVIKEAEPHVTPKGAKFRRVLVVCDCGESAAFTVRLGHIRSGASTSCGCYKRERASETQKRNLTGKTFGRLTVVKEGPGKAKDRHVRWVCRCSCGNETVVLGYKLTRGHTRSCGCLHREVAVNCGKASNSLGLSASEWDDHVSKLDAIDAQHAETEAFFKSIKNPATRCKARRHYSDLLLEMVNNAFAEVGAFTPAHLMVEESRAT